jgi:hypothetical protein
MLMVTLHVNVSSTALASTKQWYTSTTYSDNTNVKVTIDNPSRLTNKTVTITVDATKYNNGDNVIVYNPGDNNMIVTYGSKFTVKATRNGDYSFMVQRKEYYDPQFGDPKLIWCGAIINNIDTEKPTIKFVKTEVDDWSDINFLKVNVADNTSVYRVKMPDGTYVKPQVDINDQNGQGMDYPLDFEVYKNGNYTFVVEDFAGNKTTSAMTVKDCNPVPLKLDKITITSKYITGKTLPNAYLIAKTADTRFYADEIKADKKGYFKVKIDRKLKLNENIIVRVMDAKKSKYTSNKIQVKVVKK